jgi:uncharacterized damage-inducible protein DinB
MRSVNDALAQTLTNSQMLLQRYTADLTPQEYLHRPAEKANCAAWTIGHLALSDRNLLKRFGVTDLPALPDGFEKRFSRDAGCPQADDFGDVSNLMNVFNEHRALLIETVRRATPEQLNAKLDKPFPMFSTLGEMVNFMSAHTAMHAGQVTIIRRSLGRPPLV